jgi:hypothetical protein
VLRIVRPMLQLCTLHCKTYEWPSSGRLLLRMIAMCLDRYFTEPSATASRPRY